MLCSALGDKNCSKSHVKITIMNLESGGFQQTNLMVSLGTNYMRCNNPHRDSAVVEVALFSIASFSMHCSVKDASGW